MDGLYSLGLARRKLKVPEADLFKGPIFPNVPPPSREEPQDISLEGGPTLDLLTKGEQLATSLAKTKIAPGEVPSEEAAEVNPYAFWKTLIGAKEGKGGVPLDRAVALAGILASSIAPKEWSGIAGGQLAQYALMEGQAYEEWEKQRREERFKEKQLGLEKERVGLEERRVGAEERRVGVAEKGMEYEAARTQAELGLRQAQVETERETQRLKQEERKLVPEEFRLKQQEYKTRSDLYALEKRKVEAEISKIGLERDLLAKGVSREAIAAKKNADTLYGRLIDSINDKYARIPDDEKVAYTRNAEIAAATEKHIAEVQNYTDEPKAAESSVRYWFSQVEKEFDPAYKTDLTSTTLWSKLPFVQVTPTQAVVDQRARRRYYVRKAVDLLQQAGVPAIDERGRTIPENMKLFQNVALWGKRAGYSKEEVTNMLRPFGINVQ